jgi:hypothetical protein
LDLQQYKYVDKTALLARIMAKGPSNPGTFLHAPAMRRVGKSTTVKMLAAMARGEKDMFEGMQVNAEDSLFQIGERDFSVIQLDFSNVAKPAAESVGEVEVAFVDNLVRHAMEQHSVDISHVAGAHPGAALEMWLVALRSQEDNRPVVMLIDEYDAPVTTFLPKSPDLARAVAEMMKPFYQTIKTRDDFFHKVFVTGVSKFSHVSMFSAPNMFLPIMERTADFSTLYGFTEREIRETYGEFIESKFERPLDDVMTDLRFMYNGYRSHPQQLVEDLVYNPWSVLNFLDTGSLDPHWATSATSSTVVDMLGMHGLEVLAGYSITKRKLFAPISAQEHNEHWRQMAFQSGYATIKEATSLGRFGNNFALELGPPNEEVRSTLQEDMVSFLVGKVDKNLLEAYGQSLLQLDFDQAEVDLCRLIQALKDHEVPTNENQFSGYALHLLRHVEGFRSVYTEVSHRLQGDKKVGRLPSLDGALLFECEGEWHLVVIELKYDKSLDKAMEQIVRMQYVERALEYVNERSGVAVDAGRVHVVAINMSHAQEGERPEVQLRRVTDKDETSL